MKRIYLTVDTECHDIDKVNLYIYGKKGKQYYGVPKILELAKELDIVVNFFLDVAECKRYGDEYMQKIVDMIHSAGQPIWFHFHPNYVSGDDEKSFLWQYTEEEQRKLLVEGLGIYHRFCGEQDRLVFRAGRYGVNETTYKILQEFGVEVLDLSYFSHSQKMCHLPTEKVQYLNIPFKYENITLLPNSTYVGFDYLGKFHAFILNVAMSPLNEFKRFITQTKLNDVVYTMHSWDLIRKWYFTGDYIQGNNRVVSRMKKCVSIARSNGYVFSSLSDFEYKEPSSDELINLCKGFDGFLLGLYNNFIRFYAVGRLNKKYFRLYIALAAVVLILIFLIIIIAK